MWGSVHKGPELLHYYCENEEGKVLPTLNTLVDNYKQTICETNDPWWSPQENIEPKYKIEYWEIVRSKTLLVVNDWKLTGGISWRQFQPWYIQNFPFFYTKRCNDYISILWDSLSQKAAQVDAYLNSFIKLLIPLKMVEAHEFDDVSQSVNLKHSETSEHQIMKVYDFSNNFDELERNLRRSKSLKNKPSTSNYLVASPEFDSSESEENVSSQPNVLWAFYHDSIGNFKDKWKDIEYSLNVEQDGKMIFTKQDQIRIEIDDYRDQQNSSNTNVIYDLN